MSTKFYIKDGIPTINPEDVNELSNFEIIDVRRLEEFTAELGHIESAKLVTLGPDLKNFINKTEKTKQLIFVCRSGGRSGQATQDALSAGFSEVYNMDGGMLKWNALKLPVWREFKIQE
ncbi:rhodanese-like domain-containing protein [Bacteriovorax sp. PP10]|uniref:Rhodanese-like domain-containing protein n=1 Tax=Bacteriovorax antarcticus TaxID=3088717 RepID=A0ABU5VWY7_9BACT|nr:rhodanese-like domain-containing protein [Bacteriovorax sp. PP10]MEA9357573.1 rhodanese-like domain-containing protein [Bacteriovorax sp. PP10]